MALTEMQRQQRRNHVGGSDVAAIIGVDPYRGPLDVWYSKVYEMEDATNPAMDLGNRLEPAVLTWSEDHLGPVQRDVLVGLEDSPLQVRLDGLTIPGQPVEAKTSGLAGPTDMSEWGDAYTDQVPTSYLVQCHAAMIVTEQEICHLAALLGRRGFAMFTIARSDELCEQILEEVTRFWGFVETKTPPPDCRHNLETVKAIVRKPGKTISFNRVQAKLTQKWREAADARLAAEKKEDDIKAQVIGLLGDAEVANLPDGSTLQYTPTTVRSLDVRAIRSKAPEVVREYEVERLSRTLRLKTPKKG